MGKPMKLSDSTDRQTKPARPANAPQTIEVAETVGDTQEKNYDEAEVPLPPIKTFETGGGSNRLPFRMKK